MPRAQRDLSAIYDWIDAGSSDAALTGYRGLKDGIRTLRTGPNRCPVSPEDRELWHLLYGNKPHVYRVIYRATESRSRSTCCTSATAPGRNS
jgi:plasmid stabilization system protein ParE